MTDFLSFFVTITFSNVSGFHHHCSSIKCIAIYTQVFRNLQMDLVKSIFIWCLKALSLEFWIHFWTNTNNKSGMKNAQFKWRMFMHEENVSKRNWLTYDIQIAIVVATSEISANEVEPLVSVGFRALTKFRFLWTAQEFVCLCWGFTAQSTQWGHVERGQFT